MLKTHVYQTMTIDPNETTVDLEAIIANTDNILLCGAKWYTLFSPIYRDAVRGLCSDKCDGYNTSCKQYYQYTKLMEAKNDAMD